MFFCIPESTRAGRASSAATAPPTWCRLRGSLPIEHTLAKRGSEKLWNLINTEPFINSLGALTGNQAMQQVKAGLKAIYLSGWQVAADANPPARCTPTSRCTRWTRCPRSCAASTTPSARRPDPVERRQGNDVDYFCPIVADAEAGFGGRAERRSN